MVYLLLEDAKLLLRDSIYKLYLNTVYLLLRDVKLLLKDSIYKLKINTSFWGMPSSQELLQTLKIHRKLTKIATMIIFSQWWSGEKGNLY